MPEFVRLEKIFAKEIKKLIMTREFNKVVLSINAHPDDAEAWNAGVLKLLKDKGYKIVIATMTGGRSGWL